MSPAQKTLSLALSLALTVVACQSTAPDLATAAAPTDGIPGPEETPAPVDADPAAPEAPECRLQTSWDVAPATSCSTATAACVAKAATGAAVSACIQKENNCSLCFSDVLVGCLVGTPAKPGVCAGPAGCVDGCVVSVCGKKPSTSCRTEALTEGACKSLSDELQTCLEKADQRPCVESFRDQCLPKASCGDKIVNAGESCDGNCPTSCPATPPGDFCTTHALKGSAATCSAVCEQQSLCPTGCPANAVPVSTVGVIASGTALPTTTKANWPALAALKQHGCPSTLSAPSQVISWRAPAAGQYTITGTCSVTWEETEKGTGNKFTHALECVRRVALANGKQCAAGTTPFACSLDVNNSFKQSTLPDKAILAPVTLASGDELLVAVDFGLASPLPPATTANTYGGHVSATSWSVSASTCAPQCAGKTCGADGCGGTCGVCAGGQTCNAGGQCKCAPQCAGKTCGGDSCGGSCGVCAGGQTCSAGGQCQACVPQCAGKTCGGDGCGGSCGVCAGGQTCSAAGQCQAACVPQCAGKTCGSNGCGGSCGFCSASQFCNAASTCQLSAACDPVDNVGCAAPNQCITLANESNQCALMGTGSHGSPCASSTSCRGGHSCFAGTCRKICDRATGDGCGFGDSCNAVAGWFKFGACTN